MLSHLRQAPAPAAPLAHLAPKVRRKLLQLNLPMLVPATPPLRSTLRMKTSCPSLTLSPLAQARALAAAAAPAAAAVQALQAHQVRKKKQLLLILPMPAL